MPENDDDEADPADGIDDAITVLGGVLGRLRDVRKDLHRHPR